MIFFRFSLTICCVFALISLFGLGISEETPVMITVVSGVESTIIPVENGTYLVQIQIVTSNATVFSQNKSVQVPLAYAFPSNFSMAVMNSTNENGEEKTFFGRINKIQFVKENQSLVFEILPQEFSESILFVPNQTTIHEITPGLYTKSKVSFEFDISTAENTPFDLCCTFEQIENKKCSPSRPLCGY